MYALQYGGSALNGEKKAAVYNIKAIKYIGVDGYNHGEKREYHSLKLIFRHNNLHSAA